MWLPATHFATPRSRKLFPSSAAARPIANPRALSPRLLAAMSDLEKNSAGEPARESREEEASVGGPNASASPRGLPADPDAHLSPEERAKIVSSKFVGPPASGTRH